MFLISTLKRLFRRPTPYDHAKAQRNQEFAEALAASGGFLVATPDVEGLPLADCTSEKLLEAVEKAAARLKDRQTFTPFRYENQGMALLPFFTTQEKAEAFCGAYCSREETLFQFPMRAADASVLTYWIGAYPDHSLILDPQDDDEILLTPAQVGLLVRLCPPADSASARSMEGSGGRQLAVPAG